MQISDQKQFAALMERIDESLKKDGVPIHARQIQGWVRVCQMLKLSLPLAGKTTPDIYEGESLSGHIQDWFDSRYGDRLKVDFSPACFLIAIRGDLYLVRLPLIFGGALLFIDRAPRSPEQDRNQFRRGPVPCNLVDWVVDLTDGARQALSDAELNSISKSCVTALDQSSTWQKAGKEFEETIRDDLKLSATLAIDGKLGLARWHSLQAAEKAIKKFIESRGQNPPHIHNLTKLHAEATKAGLSTLGSSDLESAQCNADVRYEKKNSTQIQALVANEAARRICTLIAEQLSSPKQV